MVNIGIKRLAPSSLVLHTVVLVMVTNVLRQGTMKQPEFAIAVKPGTGAPATTVPRHLPQHLQQHR